MNIQKDTSFLLIRFNNYKMVDFIAEHQSIIKKDGFVWMMKGGKQQDQSKISKLIDNKGYLILRAPKKAGGDYYIAHILESYNGSPTTEMNYPTYYNDMVEDESLWSFDSLVGTWFRVDFIKRIPKDQIKHIKLVSNGKMAEEVLNASMTSTMYVKNDESIVTE